MSLLRFDQPDQVVWALLAIPILVFYLVRFGGRRQEVSTYVLWQRALARRSAWSRWQGVVSLLVAIVFLGMLVAAMTGPYFAASAERAPTVVLILDTSASMKATDVRPTRFARSKAQARQLVDGLTLHAKMAILSAGGLVKVHCGLTDDSKTLRHALDLVAPTDGPTCVDEAVRTARRMLADRQNPRIVVLTDGAFDGAADLAGADDVDLLIQGGTARNVAITRMQVRPSRAESRRDEALIEVANFAPQPATCGLSLGVQGQEAMEVPLKLEAGQIVQKVLSIEAAGPGLLVATLQIDDSLAADNQAQILVPGRNPRRVTFLAEADTKLEAALRSVPSVELDLVAAVPDDQPAGAITVFHRRVPPVLPLGGVMVVEPAAMCDLWKLVEPAGAFVRVAGPVRHSGPSPVLGNVDLAQVLFEEMVPLEFTQPVDSLVVSATGQPILTAIDRPEGQGRVLVLHARLDKSDLPLRPALPILLANAVRWLGDEDDTVRIGPSTSDPVAIPPATTPRRLRSPDGLFYLLAAGQTGIGRLERSGVWSVLPGGAETVDAQLAEDEGPGAAESAEMVISINLADRRESNLSADAGLAADSKDLAGGQGNPLWRWLVGLAIVITVLQWCLYHRRVLV